MNTLGNSNLEEVEDYNRFTLKKALWKSTHCIIDIIYFYDLPNWLKYPSRLSTHGHNGVWCEKHVRVGAFFHNVYDIILTNSKFCW